MSNCCQSKTATQPPTFLDNLKLYRPVVITGILALILAMVASSRGFMTFMDGFMGFALILLAFLKLLALEKFATMFRQYDPAARNFAFYSYLYPFLEAGLGILFLSGYFLFFTNIALVIIFAINTIGVCQVIRSGAKVQCGCVGASFALPVGKVTLAENMLMIFMGAVNILERIIS